MLRSKPYAIRVSVSCSAVFCAHRCGWAAPPAWTPSPAWRRVAVGGEPWFVEKQTLGVEYVFFFLSSFASEVNHVPDKNEAVVW